MTYYFDSPLGTIEIGANGRAVTSLVFADDAACRGGDAHGADDDVVALAARELDMYFAGLLTVFSTPIGLAGTEFQLSVWRALCDIPYGTTRSYRDIASAIGRPKAMRSVGGANHRNPISIIVPCHRVIGADGSLTGYGGGLWRKERLLELERAAAVNNT